MYKNITSHNKNIYERAGKVLRLNIYTKFKFSYSIELLC